MKKSIKCKIFGHKLVQLNHDDLLIKEYECVRCKQQFTTDGYGRIVKLSDYWKDNHSLFSKYSIKRNTI